MPSVATSRQPTDQDENGRELSARYLECLVLIERLHRRLLDVIKAELDSTNRSDINSVQALLLYNIGTAELTAGELRTRGYYLGSNVSYNLKKLVEMGYIHHERSMHDRRSVRVRLTQKGLDVSEMIAALYAKHTSEVEDEGLLTASDLQSVNAALLRLEQFWSRELFYGF